MNYLILVNGTLKESIKASKLILREVEGNIIDPFKVGSKEVAFSYLQLADDTMFFFLFW